MFEIPDDDENLFNDIALDDITNRKLLEHQPASNRPQLRVPETSCSRKTTKQLYSGDNRTCREFDSSPEKQADSFASHAREGVSFTRPPTENAGPGPRIDNSTMTTPVTIAATVLTRSSGANTPSAGDYITPKRKRKFPGPAGLLPQLEQGKSIDIQAVSSAQRTLQHASTPIQEGRDPEPPSSQSSDDVFCDIPWQALQADLGEDGVKMMKKFSIGCTLLKAGKRQLYQGKAVLLCGVIDFMESHGCEASVTIRDRSGKMQGTVHRDLLKEYEAELQIGTVLVLKQVSIISLSNRNHYLNITPSNLVCLYHSKLDKLTRLKFHGSQESLRSVLSALEKKAASRSEDSSSISGSGTGSSRLSLAGSSTGTPILAGSLPNTPVLNQRLSRPGTPYSTHTHSRLSTPADIRDVSVIRPDISSTPLGCVKNNSDRLDSAGQNSVTNGRLSSLLQNNHLNKSGNRPSNSGSGNVSVTVRGINSDKLQTVGSNNVGGSDNVKTVSTSVSKPQTWNFKHKSPPGRPELNRPSHVPISNNNLDETSGRSCQLSASVGRLNSGSSNSTTTGSSSTSKWSFKARTSPGSSNPPTVVQRQDPKQSMKSTEEKQPQSVSTEELWDDDDLNDEILSQLSDEMS